MAIIIKPISKHPLLFVHIPKCAGGTIKYYFNITYNEQPNNYGHCKLCSYKNEVPSFDYDKFFKFTCLRNPWDRLLSLFKFRTQASLRKKDTYWNNIVQKKINFKNWIKIIKEDTEYRSIHCASYFSYLSHNKANIDMDFIINFHNFKEDFNKIKVFKNRKIYYLPKDKKTKHKFKHSSKHKDFRNYYDSDSIEIVANIYKKDIDLFNYDFDNYKFANYSKYQNFEKIKQLAKMNK